MSLGPITNLEWLNRNSMRAFPIGEDTAPVLSSGVPLPNDILVDAFIVAALPGPGKAAIYSVTFTPATITAVIWDEESGKTIGYATAVKGRHHPNSSIPIQSSDGLSSGSVTFGAVMELEDFTPYLGVHRQPVGVYLEARCVIFTGVPMVSSLEADLQDGVASGDVTLSLGEELQAVITEDVVNGCEETTVELSLVSPENFLPDCYPIYIDPLCFCGQLPIITINGVPRDENDEGIDIIFGNGLLGQITNDELRNLISLLVSESGDSVCFEDPIIPDTFGRLGPLFGQDCPPITGYGLSDSGPACPNPAPSVPLDSSAQGS